MARQSRPEQQTLLLPPLAMIEAKAELPALRQVALAVALFVLTRLMLNWYVYGEHAPFYYGKDKEQWRVQVNDPNFKQSRCFPESSEVVMFKCRQTFDVDTKSLISVVLDSDVRSKWDTKIVDWKRFYANADCSYARYYFNFVSPARPFIDDRDFYII